MRRRRARSGARNGPAICSKGRWRAAAPQVDETLDFFGTLKSQHHEVAAKTRQLHDSCQQLVRPFCTPADDTPLKYRGKYRMQQLMEPHVKDSNCLRLP